jgi:hypothetical protein
MCFSWPNQASDDQLVFGVVRIFRELIGGSSARLDDAAPAGRNGMSYVRIWVGLSRHAEILAFSWIAAALLAGS